MKDEFIKSIGTWGRRHYNYLKKHNTTVIDVMRMNETLEQYMRDIDRDAEEMFSQLCQTTCRKRRRYRTIKSRKSNVMGAKYEQYNKYC